MVININSKIFQNKFLNPYMKTIAWTQNCWLSLLRKIALISGLTLFLHSLSIISQSTDPRNLLTCDINTNTKPSVGSRFNPHAWISLTYTTHRVNIVHLGHQIAPIAPRNLICASTKPAPSQEGRKFILILGFGKTRYILPLASWIKIICLGEF